METTFKFSRKMGQYIQIDYVTDLKALPWFTYGHVWVSTANEGRVFISMVRKLEEGIKKEIIDKNYDFDFRLVILKYLSVIENIASGLDIRSKLSIQELVEGFSFGYNQKRNEAKEFCEAQIQYAKDNYETETYMKNWRKYDKANSFIREYHLPFKLMEGDFFKSDTLDELLAKTNELLDKLIEKRKKMKDEERN